MKTIKIKGKDYVEVKERVKVFNNDYKDHYLLTEVNQFNEQYVLIVARIYNKEGVQVANGWAFERQSDGNVNKSSFVENCETSAVGRALGFFGIGIDASIASADEMQSREDDPKIKNKLMGVMRVVLESIPNELVQSTLNDKAKNGELTIAAIVNGLADLYEI